MVRNNVIFVGFTIFLVCIYLLCAACCSPARSGNNSGEWRAVLKYELIQQAPFQFANESQAYNDIIETENREVVIEKMIGDALKDKSKLKWILCSLISVSEISELKTLVYESNSIDCSVCGPSRLLWLAVTEPHYELVEYCLSSLSCDPNAVDDGITPLLYAVMDEDRVLVDLLIKYGADPDMSISTGGSPRQIDNEMQTELIP